MVQATPRPRCWQACQSTIHLCSYRHCKTLCGYLKASSNRFLQQPSLGPCKIAISTVLHAHLFNTRHCSGSVAVLHLTANSSSCGR